jgi:hypothetical protein
MPKGQVRDTTMIILLGIVTCGWYGVYLNYVHCKEINTALGREAINPTFGICSFFVPVAYYYIHCLTGAFAELSHKTGKPPYKSEFVTWILTFFLGSGVYLTYHAQAHLNSVWEA